MITRKEMAKRIVDNQISRGIVKKEDREFQINARLKGTFSMSWSRLHDDCKSMNLLKDGE